MNLNDKNQRWVEIFLVLITVCITCVLYQTVGHKMIVLNLFYLPVVQAGFFLGRYRAGVLALLSVVGATIVIVGNMNAFAAVSSPVIVGLSITVWGSVLGLTSLLGLELCATIAQRKLSKREKPMWGWLKCSHATCRTPTRNSSHEPCESPP